MRRTLLVLGLAFAAGVDAQDPRFAFTYQGELRVASVPANGPYDFEFALFMQPTGGAALATVAIDDRTVTGGLFNAELNFGSTPFAADMEYWLEPRVRDGASSGSYTSLLPRQKVTPAPRALSTYTVQAGGVDANAVQAGAIGETKLADGAVTNAKIAQEAITSEKIERAAVGASQVAAAEVQLRTDEMFTGCAGPNQSLKGIDETGAVTCEPDDGIAYTAGTGISLAGDAVAIVESVVPRKDGAANQSFDAGTLVLDYANDRVGVGVPAPAVKLEVAGTVAGNALAYRTARNGYVWVGAPDFTRNETGEDDSIGFLNSSYLLPICVGTCDLGLHAGLNLPAEATIDDFRCYFYDTHATTDITGNMFLSKRAFDDPDAVSVAGGAFTSAGANGMVAVSNSFVPELATPFTHVYTVTVFPTFGAAPANTQRFYGCRVRYTYTQVAH